MHLIFLSGLPHSGTTLLARFLALHPEIYVMAEWNTSAWSNKTMEWRPNGALQYGGSGACLANMCGKYLENSTHDVARTTVEHYVAAARRVRRKTVVFKDPATMLVSGRLQDQCTRLAIHCSFIQTVIDLWHWQVPRFGCGYCRSQILAYGSQCYERAANQTGSRLLVNFTRLNRPTTWRNIESYLGLSRQGVTIVYSRRLEFRLRSTSAFVVDTQLLKSKGCLRVAEGHASRWQKFPIDPPSTSTALASGLPSLTML